MSYRLIAIQKSGVGLIYFQNKLISISMEHSLYKVSDIYLGRISTILPSLDAAFVTLNPMAKNGFISFDQPKDKNQLNSKLNSIKINNTIIVQVTREPIGTKGPSVSCGISLVGKYLVLAPISQSISITRRICTDTERDYVKAISYLLINPKRIGIMAKSGILQANVNFLIKEIKILKYRWSIILSKSLKTSQPSLLSKRKNFLNKILEDYSTINFEFIAVDSDETAKKLKLTLNKIKKYQKKQKTIIEVHTSELDLIKYYLIDIILTEIMKPRVNLPKGGYIIIEKTEALTTIDVNSGSFTTLHNSRQTSLWVNYSAAYEIVKQIRLRNIGGIIIVDFIDSTNQVDQMKLLQYISKLVKKDFIKCTIVQISELGLVEMTRTRYGQSVYDAFSRRCTVCNGLGYLTIDLNPLNRNCYELIIENISTFHKLLCKRTEKLYD